MRNGDEYEQQARRTAKIVVGSNIKQPTVYKTLLFIVPIWLKQY
jgi:hypothetical protein